MLQPEPESVAEVRKVIAVQFGILSPKRIRDMSVAEIKLPALKVVRLPGKIHCCVACPGHIF